MRKLFLRLIPALLILALAACFGGGSSDDNPAAGVEPANNALQQDSGELLINDNIALPTENATDDNGGVGLELTGTPDPDSALVGSASSDEALFSGGGDSGALDGGSGDTTLDLFGEATASVTPGT